MKSAKSWFADSDESTARRPQRSSGSRLPSASAYRISAFTDLDTFKEHMDTFLKGLRETPTAPGEERVLYPGLPEHETLLERSERGIPYHPEVVDYFRKTAGELGVAHELG